MSLDAWLDRMRTTVSRVEERLDAAGEGAAGTVTRAESGCRTVRVTVDTNGRLERIAFRPGSFAEHDPGSLRQAVLETYNLAKRQWPKDRRANFDAAYHKER